MANHPFKVLRPLAICYVTTSEEERTVDHIESVEDNRKKHDRPSLRKYITNF